MSKQIPNDVKSFVRAILISSPSGVKQTKFCREYETFAKCRLEWRKMGFKDLYEFLLAIPDVARVEYSPKNSQNLVFGVVKNDVYSSIHAMKAGKKGTGQKARPPSEWGKPSTSRTVDVANANGLASLKVTVSNEVREDGITPNEQGLYGIHIKNLPNFCTKEELELLFKGYPSLRLCKIITNNSITFAFAKFKSEQDAVKAMKEKDGYNLRGCKLKLSKATEGSVKAKQNSEGSQGAKGKDLPKHPKLPPLNTKPMPKVNKVVVNNVNVLSEIELMQLYSKYGFVQHVEKHGDSASLSFSTEEEALATLKNMNELLFEGQKLALSPQGNNPQSNMFANVAEQRSPSSINHILDAGTSRDLSRRGSTTSTAFTSTIHGDLSTTSNSSKESIFSNYGAVVSPKESLERRPNDNISSQERTNLQYNQPQKQQQNSQPDQQQQQQQQQQLHPLQEQLQKQQQQRRQQQQLQHQQQLQQQHQQQPQQRSTSNATSSTSLSSNQHQPLEQNVHLILTKEEMEKLGHACNHPFAQRFQNLPGEIDVLITEVVDACHFWAIIDNKTGNWNQLEALEECLQKASITNSVVPQKYTIGAGKFTENNMWYRCFVMDVSTDHKFIKVLYTDYGNAEWIPLERFMSLDSLYLSLPPQAHAFHLAGLEINYSNSTEIQLEGAKYLRKLIGDKTLLARRKAPVDVTRQGHILEVEVFSKLPPNDCVNKRMAATKYVNTNTSIPIPLAMSSPTSLTDIDTRSAPALSNRHQTIKLKISLVQSAQHIFYHEATPETKGTLETIEKLLDRILNVNVYFPAQINELACFVSRAYGRKRVRILENPVPVGAKLLVKVHCIDYGNQVNVEVNSLLQLPLPMLSIPPYAREAHVAGLTLPPNLPKWPETAVDILVSCKDQVLDGKIIKVIHAVPHLELYNSQGECLNHKIMEAVGSKYYMKASTSMLSAFPTDSVKANPSDLSIELGPAPISPKPVLPFKHPHQPVNEIQDTRLKQTSQQENTTSKSDFQKRAVAIPPQQNSPTFKPHVMPANEKSLESQSRGNVGSNTGADFYMPPPPCVSKELPNKPQGSQASGKMGMAMECSPIPRNGGGFPPSPNLPYGGQSPQMMSVSMDNSPMIRSGGGFPSSNSRTQGTKPFEKMGVAAVGSQISRNGGGFPPNPNSLQGGQAPKKMGVPMDNSPMGMAMECSPIPRNGGGFPPSPNLPYGGQAPKMMGVSIDNSPMTRNGDGFPSSNNHTQGTKPLDRMGVAAIGSETDRNEGGLPSSAQAPSGITSQGLLLTPTNIPSDQSPPSSGPLNKQTLQNENLGWQKEKEALLVRRKEQELCLEKLNKQGAPTPSTQNLQQLKTKLAKQVRIKELENKVLKLRKDIESLEATKADLQYNLIN